MAGLDFSFYTESGIPVQRRAAFLECSMRNCVWSNQLSLHGSWDHM